MAEHSGADSGEGAYGPIRPEDADDGWTVTGDRTEWWLVKDFGEYRGSIRATTRTTCAWRIDHREGRMAREASARTVADARAAADAWVRDATAQP